MRSFKSGDVVCVKNGTLMGRVIEDSNGKLFIQLVVSVISNTKYDGVREIDPRKYRLANIEEESYYIKQFTQ